MFKPLLIHDLGIPLVSFVAYFIQDVLVRDFVKSDMEIHVLYSALIIPVCLQLLSPKNSRFFKIYFLPQYLMVIASLVY